MTSSQHNRTRENQWPKPKHSSGQGRQDAPHDRPMLILSLKQDYITYTGNMFWVFTFMQIARANWERNMKPKNEYVLFPKLKLETISINNFLTINREL